MTTTVWIIQDIPNRDFTQAVKLGDEVKVVALRDYPLWDERLQDDHASTMRRVFACFNPETDFAVLAGDPVNIGVVFNMVMEKGGGKFLKFDKHIHGYHLINFKGEKNGKKDKSPGPKE